MKSRGYFLIAGVVFFVFSTFYFAGMFVGLEYFFEDILFFPKSISPEIVVLAIDDESISRVGQWPWPRKVFADAINALSVAHPKAVAIDVLFSEPSRLGQADDLSFQKALSTVSYPVVFPIQGNDIVIRGVQAYSQTFLASLPLFTENPTVSLGHVNLVTDRDGVSRQFFSTLVMSDGRTFSSLGEEAFRRSTGAMLGSSFDRDIERLVYAGPPKSFVTVPFWRVLDGSAESLLNDKIVLIGATAPSLHDVVQTPVSFGSAMAGVEVQAHIANMRLFDYHLNPLSSWLVVLLILFSVLVPVLLFGFFSSFWIPALLNFLAAIVELSGIVFLFQNGIVVPIVYGLGAWVFSSILVVVYRYLTSETHRRHLKTAFSKYVSPQVLNEIMRHPENITLGGEEREVTVFFSDIRGFTTISEKTTPTELVRILNKYFTAMTAQVLNNAGVVDKYIGDAIMAFWGAPIPDASQADHALTASLAMLDELKKLNIELKAVGDPEIKIGIGLHTGKAVVGNVGSDQRFDYTVIGDTVNAASRLEGLNKEYKTQIIISEAVKNKITGNYPFKHLGNVQVKGKKEPLSIFTIEGTEMEGADGEDHAHH